MVPQAPSAQCPLPCLLPLILCCLENFPPYPFLVPYLVLNLRQAQYLVHRQVLPMVDTYFMIDCVRTLPPFQAPR